MTAGEGIPPEQENHRHLIQVALYVVLAVVSVIAVTTLLLPEAQRPWNDATGVISAGLGLLYVAAWWLLRRGHVATGAAVFTAGVLLGSWVPVFWPGAMGTRSVGFVFINVLIAALVMGPRAAATVGGLDLVALAVVYMTRDGYGTLLLMEDLLLGGIIGAISIATAFHQRHGRTALRSSRDRLAQTVADLDAMLENNPDAIVALDPDCAIRAANDAAHRLARQHTRRDLPLGVPVEALLPQAEMGQLRALVDDARDGDPVTSDIQWDSADGPMFFRIHVRAIEGGGATVQVHDATAERRAERAQRTAYEARLELDSLREMQRFRTRLLNTASHELRTPITPLRLQMHMLNERLRGRLDEKEQRSFDMMDRSIRRLAMLVDDLLDVARLERQGVRMSKVPLRMDELARVEAEPFHSVARQRGVELRVDVERVQVQADPDRIGQVVTNLLSNALRYAHGAVDLKVREDGEGVTVSIRDDGRGFTEEEHKLLFQPFAQLEDERRKDSTGLGLFICQGIIDQHDGSIWAHSDGPDRGATFAFHLPRAGGRTSLKQEAPPLSTHD